MSRHILDELREGARQQQAASEHHHQLNKLAELLLKRQGYWPAEEGQQVDCERHPVPRVRQAYDMARLAYEFVAANPKP